MLETLAGWNEDIVEGVFAFEETVERGTTAIISPGARYAFNLPNDAQLVIGAALIIGGVALANLRKTPAARQSIERPYAVSGRDGIETHAL